MNEELYMEKGASLADCQAPETISNKRAHIFVERTIRGHRSSRNVLRRWWWVASAVAVAAVIAFFILLPSGSVSGDSRPSTLFESESIHAGMSVADTVDCTDSTSRSELPIIE